MRRFSSVFLSSLLFSLSLFLVSPITVFASGTWTTVGSMAGTRAEGAATVLPNGKVLVAGGENDDSNSRTLIPFSELYDPSTQTWSQSGNLNVPREFYPKNSLVLLANGKALLPGGTDLGDNAYSTAELYDYTTGTWSNTGSLNQARRMHVTVLLSDGRVLVAGGVDGPQGSNLASAELYDPSTGTWSNTGSLNTARQEGVGILLPNGKVLITGGDAGSCSCPTSSAELYDPSTGTWSNAASMPYTSSLAHSLTLLQNGKVLLAGGRNLNGFLATAAIYDPATDTWTSTPSMLESRGDHSAALLQDGKVIVVAGANNGGTLNTTEIYDPVANSWSMGSSLQQARAYHVMVTLPDNTLLASGGNQQFSPLTALASAELYSPSPFNITLPNVTLNEGATYTATGSFTDTNPNATSWTATIDYGDGSGSQPLTLSGTNFSLSHVYKDNGTYTVTVSVTDNQGATGTGTATVTVNNVPPTVGIITAPSSPVLVNTAITASASFTDPGVNDTHAATWNWGDGNASTGTVTESNGSGSVSNTHTYTATGVYTITLTVTDKDGGVGTSTFQYVAVYDSTTSFAGGRSFDNPTSASPNTSGKVSFGISAKYNSSNVLTGNAKMDFKAANLDFASTSLTSLATSNGKAYLKGTGTVNGSGSYTFLATGIDGSVVGGNDLIRFQIKDASGNVVYDSQPGASDTTDPTTQVATGNVRVH
jgi:N-acetylneuraminic acid mutarotase/PKD repeat protein